MSLIRVTGKEDEMLILQLGTACLHFLAYTLIIREGERGGNVIMAPIEVKFHSLYYVC